MIKSTFVGTLLLLMASCATAAPLYNSFNSGELSPLIKYRVDLDKRSMGVETMENFLVKPQGAAVRRPGTRYVATSPITILGTDPNLAHTIPISTIQDLNSVRANLSGHYYLTKDIDASVTSTWRSGKGFAPIGTGSPAFTGTLDGCGYTISNLYINDRTPDFVGLFGSCSGAYIYNLNITNANITAGARTGILAGSIGATTVQGVTVSGSINANSAMVGGLIGGEGGGGNNNHIKNCAVISVAITGSSNYCGLFSGNNQGEYIDCFASGSIVGTTPYYNGGFVGAARQTSSFTRCQVTGTIPSQVKGSVYTNGGFAGTVDGSPPTIAFNDCYYLATINEKAFGGQDEVQVISATGDFGMPTGGYWTISFGGITTGHIAYNATEAQTQAALNAAFGTGVIEAAGDMALKGNRTQSLYFRKQYSRTDVAMASADGSHLTGGSYAFAVTQYSACVYPASATTPISAPALYNTVTNTKIRLIPFEYSTSDAYVIEMGNQYMRFYRNGGQIVDSNGAAYQIRTPITTTDLPYVQFVQSNDIMYLVCPRVAPQKLSRYSHTNWTIASVDWQWGPFLDENTTTTTITPSAKTGSVTLTASANIFDANHVGSIWKITGKNSDQAYTSGKLDANEASVSVKIEGEALLTLDGTWVGLVTLEKSIVDANSWEPVYPKLNGDAANIEYSFNEQDSGYEYRVIMTDYTSGHVDYTLTAYNTDVSGYVTITAYVSPTQATATVVQQLPSTTATSKWSEGAWSDYRGWPRAICLYQNRLVLAGTTYMPNGVWLSQSADFENMQASTLDSGAIIYEIGSAKQNPILWLQDKNGIIAGTSGSVIRIASQSTTSTLTPSSIGSERQSDAGSTAIQPALTGDSIVFIDRDKRKVHDMIYDLQSDGFVSPELSMMAEHITDPCIVEMAVQNRPDNVIWMVRGDGVLDSLTYNRQQQVVAWARHITDGDVESVAVIPSTSSTTSEDEVWIAVKRTIDGNTVRYIEQMQPQDWGSDPNDCWFIDSGLSSHATHTGNHCLQFDGSAGYVTVADANSLDVGTGDFSISFWIKIPTALVDVVSIIEKKGVASTGYKIELLIGDDSGKLKVTTLGGETFIVSTPDTIADNAWHFIAVTGDKTNSPYNLSIYLDTTLVDSEPQFDNQGNMTNASDLIIGGTANFFAGSLDDIRIYKTALTSAEIAEIYTSGRGIRYETLSTGTAASWATNCDDTGTTTVTDDVETADGTITGSVTFAHNTIAVGYKRFTGLSHLVGETVDALCDGYRHETTTVDASGIVYLTTPADNVTIGLPYTSTLTTFPVEVQTGSGYSVGYKKRIPAVVACFYKSMYGQYGIVNRWQTQTLYNIPFTTWPDATTGARYAYTPYSGQIRLFINGRWDDEVAVQFKQADPFPMNITALATKVEISEN